MSSGAGRSWIVTCTNNGVFLTYDVMVSGKFDIDECHYTSDTAVVYTYFHFRNTVTKKQITAFMERMKSEQNVSLFEVFGYESISLMHSGMDPSEHIGFKMLLDHYRTGNDRFVSCTDGSPGITRGVFWNRGSIARLKDALGETHKRLRPFVEELEKELMESRNKDSTIELLQAQVTSRESRIINLRGTVKELQDYEFVCHVLRHRLKEMDKSVRDVLLAPDHRGLPLMPNFFKFE